MASLPASLGLVIHLLVEHDIWDLEADSVLNNSAAFSSFTFVLGFVLVFRSNHCYLRFWHCASGVATMKAQMLEAASSLVSFASMSKKSAEEVDTYRNIVIRLVSLWHAIALSVIAEQENEEFPVLDLPGLDPEKIYALRPLNGRCQVDAVYAWLNALIIESLANGLLNIPPPILSRVFQELEKAMIEFNTVMQAMDIPFPFPYAQAAMILVVMYACISPIVIAMWAGNWAVAFILTFLGNCCFISLEIISNELDQPFGDDPNDLPAMKFQLDLNESLVLLLAPLVQGSPALTSEAQRTHADLSAGQDKWISLTSFFRSET